MHYKLIGFDMDGTLLNSKKEVSQKTAQAIRRATEAGVVVVYLSGRSLPELRPYVKDLPEIRYGICLNGSILYDFQTDETLGRFVLSEEEVDAIIDASGKEDIMLELMAEGNGHTARRDIEENLARYQVAKYKELFLATSIMVDDIKAMLRDRTYAFEKIDLYHADEEAVHRTYERLRPFSMEQTIYHGTHLEVTTKGVDKGAGLRRLCVHLGISPEETIAVGDSLNDLPALKAAGFSVAMGNADKEVIEICDAVVADNDHDGCAEVIGRFVLQESKPCETI